MDVLQYVYVCVYLNYAVYTNHRHMDILPYEYADVLWDYSAE